MCEHCNGNFRGNKFSDTNGEARPQIRLFLPQKAEPYADHGAAGGMPVAHAMCPVARASDVTESQFPDVSKVSGGFRWLHRFFDALVQLAARWFSPK